MRAAAACVNHQKTADSTGSLQRTAQIKSPRIGAHYTIGCIKFTN